MMKTQVVLTIMKRPAEPQTRPPATAALILGIKNPTSSVQADPSGTQSLRDTSSAKSESFREDLRRRQQTPFKTPWDHGGLNE